MAGKDEERENYFKICILVVDHIKHALVDILLYYLRQYKMSFEKFIGAHMKEIKYLRKSKILYQEEVDKFVVGDNAISSITVDALEVTLVRRLLDNLCPELFMDDGCKTLQDFLKKNHHDIYHLFKWNQRCCQCTDYYQRPVGEELLKEKQYKNMFESSPCGNCTGTRGAACSELPCKDTAYIRLDYGTRCKVFEHFSCIFKAMQKLKQLRDIAYGHIDAAVMSKARYDDHKKDIEDNIMALARISGNEDKTRLALAKVQTCSYNEKLCIQLMFSLTEQVKRDIELMEGIGENHQMLQEINQRQQKNNKILEKLREQLDNMNLNKDVGVSCGLTVVVQTSTQSSGNQSSQTSSFVKTQINIGSQTQQHQLDDRSLEHQNLQTLNNDIPSTSTQPPILGNQNLMNQTNIERNNIERCQGQKIAVVPSGGLMRNSEPQNLYSSVNPTDDHAGAMMSFSPESSSNNISTGNDQSGQVYQSSIGTDAEPYISNVNNERVENRSDICDGVVLHADEDRSEAIKFIANMHTENPDLKIDIALYENIELGSSVFETPAKLFDSYRYLFVFVTENFGKAKLERVLSQIATMETLTFQEKNARLIPVKTDKTYHSALAHLNPLKYYNYLEAKQSQQGPDQFFIECFRNLIINGRLRYLVN